MARSSRRVVSFSLHFQISGLDNSLSSVTRVHQSFFLCTPKVFQSYDFVYAFFPHPLWSLYLVLSIFYFHWSLNLVLYFNWEFFLVIETEKSLTLPRIKLNKSMISLERGFHQSPHIAPGNFLHRETRRKVL